MIDSLPFIISYQDKKTLGVYLDIDNDFSIEQFIKNVGSALVLCPEKINYICRIDSRTKEERLINMIKKILGVFERRSMSCNVSVEVLCDIQYLNNCVMSGSSNDGLVSQLDSAFESLIKKYNGKGKENKTKAEKSKVKFCSYKLHLYGGESFALKLLSLIHHKTKQRGIDCFDFSNILDENIVEEMKQQKIAMFEFEPKKMLFHGYNGMEFLSHLELRTNLRIEELAYLMDACVGGFYVPEGLQYYERLWKIYTGSYNNARISPETCINKSIKGWYVLIDKLWNDYYKEEYRRFDSVAFDHATEQNHNGSMDATSIFKCYFGKGKTFAKGAGEQYFEKEYMFPEKSFTIVAKIVNVLKEHCIIEDESSISGNLDDACVMKIKSKYSIGKELFKMVSWSSYLEERYVNVEWNYQTQQVYVKFDVGYDWLQVRNLKFNFLNNNDKIAWRILAELKEQGLIYTACEMGNPDQSNSEQLLSFNFASPVIKKILQKKGELLEMFVYDKLMKSELFDDVVWGCELFGNDNINDEVDCILVKGFQTVFIECKARKFFSQDEGEKIYETLKRRSVKYGCNGAEVLCWQSYGDTRDDTTRKNNNEMKRIGEEKYSIKTISSNEDFANISELIYNQLALE